MTLQNFSSATPILNLLLKLSNSQREKNGFSLNQFPLAVVYTNKHLARRNIQKGDRFVVEARDLNFRKEASERVGWAASSDNDRLKISRRIVISSRTKSKSNGNRC